MTDNRQELSESTIVLTHAHPGDDAYLWMFPNAEEVAGGPSHCLAGSLNGEVFAWVLFEGLSDTSVCIHLYVLPEYRIPSVFKVIKRDVPGLFQKFMEEEDIQRIVAVCDYNNKASMKLQKLLGFEPQAYWMGAQNRR